MQNDKKHEEESNEDGIVFFYGHNVRLGPRACFSNWYPARFVDGEGRVFENSEQYLMYRKAVLFEDEAAAAACLQNSSPAFVKRKGRKVRGFDDAVWKQQARGIMEEGCYMKFSQNEDMRDALLHTGEAVLAEAAPKDCLWGIGLSAGKARSVPQSLWPGSNWLGEVLVRVRTRLVAEHGAHL